VTTINAAAAWRVSKPITFAAFATIFSLSLGGCGTTTGLFPSSSEGQSTTLSAQESSQQIATAQSNKIAIAPVIGAPDVIAKLLRSELSTALGKKNIVVANSPTDNPRYTLRGYVVSAREKTKTKISYIWDVTDSAGKRVNRINGEELAPSGSNSDPWAAMTPGIVQTISTKTAASLATWLPTQVQPAASAAVAGAASTKTSTAGAAAKTAAQAAANSAVPVSGTTTGSINKAGPVMAMVPSVSGAPGDGGVSLTRAIQNELKRNGVKLASAATSATYRVEGQVKVGAGKAGKQPIQIDWHVKDPAGNKLGTVSQKNEIPQGSLDGAWGKTADAAAAAASQGILKLLPKPTRTN